MSHPSARGNSRCTETSSVTAPWNGQTIIGADVLVMYACGGDANLSGEIDTDDSVRIDQRDAAHLAGWSNGDFNDDGKINIDDDTTIIDSNIGNPGPPLGSASGLESSIAAVPEPTAMTVLIFPAMLLTSRRRRRFRLSNSHG